MRMLSSIRGTGGRVADAFHGVKIDADRAQDLADFIVQLAGEVTALFFLNFDNAAGEDLQACRRLAQGLLRPACGR